MFIHEKLMGLSGVCLADLGYQRACLHAVCQGFSQVCRLKFIHEVISYSKWLSKAGGVAHGCKQVFCKLLAGVL